MALMFQCRLRRGNAEQVAWIEARGANVGNSVELSSGDGFFWRVAEVYDHAIDEKLLREKQARDRNALPSIAGR